MPPPPTSPSAEPPRRASRIGSRPRATDTDRRSLLAGLGAVGVSALAGCTAVDDAVGADPRRFPAGDWPMVGRDAGNSSSFPGVRAPASVEKRWEAPIDRWPYTGPVSANGLVFVPAGDRLYALSTRTGEEEWTTELPHETGGTPALGGDGRLCVTTRKRVDGGDEAYLHGYDPDDGRRIWSRRLGPGTPYAVRIADGTAFVRTAGACVAVGVDHGDLLWRTGGFGPLAYDEFNLDETYAVEVAPTVADGQVYVPARDALVALDRDDGGERWRVGVPYCYASPTVGPDGVVYARGHAERMAAVAPDGSIHWRVDDGGIGAPAATDDAVFLAYADLVEIDREDGAERWRYDLRSDLIGATPVAFADAVVAVGTRSGAVRREARLFGLRGRGRRWTLPSSTADIVSPCVADRHLFVLDPFRGRVMAFA